MQIGGAVLKRVGIYGGTFNPPHLGHFGAAAFAVEALALQKLLMIPTGISPHKQLPEGSPTAQQRLEMVRLGVDPELPIEVSDMELRREGPSYTYETVERVGQQYPDAELYLLMGTDMFLSFSEWKNPERILAAATLAVFCRGEKNEKQAISEQKSAMEQQGARVVLVENPVLTISSTDLRRLLALGCASEFLPTEVERYIRGNGLYGTGKDRRNLSEEQLEQEVVRLLKPNRVSHVLGCRQTAVELAQLYGASVTDAARAALLHDVTKALDGPLQLTLCREYGTILDAFSTKNPKTLHAHTGSLVAEKVFGENEAVVNAIRSHTTGKADMTLLEKIIYVADYMEPNRDFPGVEHLRSLAYSNIDEALRQGLEMTLNMLQQEGREISPESRQALAWLKQ